MRRVILFAFPDRLASFRRPVFWLQVGLLAALAAPGCHHEEKPRSASVADPPTVRLIQPPVRKIVRVVGQPSFVESYERSSVYPKMNAYIKEWKVDIGDKVKKDQVLATLFVPELVEDHGTRKATVILDQQRILLAKEVVLVAKADVQAAEARLEEARAELTSYQAEVDRWDSEVKRLDYERVQGVVNPQDVLQATNRWKSSLASWDSSKATVMKAEAELLSKRASLSKAQVNVRVAEADLKVAESEEKRLKAWVGYLTLPAPFDGVIVTRNANTFDFVLPTSGDPSADSRVPHLSPSGAAAPIYVVDRTDIVRIFVDIPEEDANYVRIGSKATILVKAFRDRPISASVTRTSWALNVNSRTLRAEIDLHNPDSQLLPGMYAYAKVIIERPSVRRFPVSALMHVGEKTFCWRYEDGHAKRFEVQTGLLGDPPRDPLKDVQWIEVTNCQVPPPPGGADHWAPIDGTEQMILGDLSILAEGGPVEIAKQTTETKVASATPTPGPTTSHSSNSSRPTSSPATSGPVESSTGPVR